MNLKTKWKQKHAAPHLFFFSFPIYKEELSFNSRPVLLTSFLDPAINPSVLDSNMASTSDSDEKTVISTKGTSGLPPIPQKTIIITGGSGFIGGELVIHLANQYAQSSDPYRYDFSV
jgi:hypothetical protein